MHEITIRGDGGDLLKIALLGRSNSDAVDYWDGNWLQAVVDVEAGGFRGSVTGFLRADELGQFQDELAILHELLYGTADFQTLEGWLSIQVTGDDRGHMVYRCLVRDQAGTGNTLEFTIANDQTFTKTTLAELAAVMRMFPVIGRP